MKFRDKIFKPLQRNLLKTRFANLNKRPSPKRAASIKLVKRYFRLLR